MKRIISGFLILLLLLPAGCKQQNTEPAAPGTVVENTEEDQQLPDKNLVDYYVCKYYVTLKDEYVVQNYTEANFPEMDITDFSVNSYKYPGDPETPCLFRVALTVEMTDRNLMEQYFQTLQQREDIIDVYAEFNGYLVEETANERVLPDLSRELVSGEAPNGSGYSSPVYDGTILVTIKDGVLPSPSLFADLNIDGISGFMGSRSSNQQEGFSYARRFEIYVKERGKDSLYQVIEKLKENENVERADYSYERIASIDEI